MNPLNQFRLLQLASPSLPVGGFTYSQGLEWATEAGWVSNVASFKKWQLLQMKHTLVHQDLPVLVRLAHACEQMDLASFKHWSHYLISCRETAELRQEERQRGAAFLRVLEGLGLFSQQDSEWRQALALTQTGGMTWAGWRWELPIDELVQAVGYAWIENAVMAGVKLVPFGQQAAQSLLVELSDELAQLLPHVHMLEDDEMGGSLPLVAIASALHETQHTRLFRS